MPSLEMVIKCYPSSEKLLTITLSIINYLLHYKSHFYFDVYFQIFDKFIFAEY